MSMSSSSPNSALLGEPHGAKIDLLDGTACEAWIRHATDRVSPPPGDLPQTNWLLAHCDDGVVWGFPDAGGWALSGTVFPDVSPPLSSDNLQQLRLFGPDGEVLIWRVADGFRGRILCDNGETIAIEELRPADESIIVLGDRPLAPSQGGFTLLGDNKGAWHAVPINCESEVQAGRKSPVRLNVRHYFQCDEETGLVRASATRLVDLCLTTISPTPRGGAAS